MKSPVVSLTALSALVFVAGCSASASGGSPDGVTPMAVEASPAPAAAVSPIPSPSAVVAKAVASPVAGVMAPVSIDVQPPQVQSGTVLLSMSVPAAKHMVPQTAAVTSDADPAHQMAADPQKGQASTALVLEGLLQTANNVDLAQPLPDDQPGAILRHVAVTIAADNYAVPYLSASMDMLLDGRPALSNVPLVPMIDAQASTVQLYYGNNIKLAQRGTYQVFVRVLPSALLGKDTPPAAQFNMTVQ